MAIMGGNSMTKVTGISFVRTAEGLRVAYAYS